LGETGDWAPSAEDQVVLDTLAALDIAFVDASFESERVLAFLSASDREALDDTIAHRNELQELAKVAGCVDRP
jgi:hypothetical protein